MPQKFSLEVSLEELQVLWEILEFHRDDEEDIVPYSREAFWNLLENKIGPLANGAGLS